MKKKILILMPSMFIGGAERSLIGLLDSMDYEKYDVDLFLYRHEGEFLNLIHKRVNILPQNDDYRTFDTPIKDILFSRNFKFGIARLLSKLDIIKKSTNGKEKNVWSSMQYISKRLVPMLPNITGEYDLAINFLGIGDVLVNKVNAKKKITWVHTDYMKLVPDKKLDLKTYSQIDYIVNVSDKCEESFLKVYPQLENKSLVIENIISDEFLKKQANEIVNDTFNKDSKKQIILLSVGRFSDAKNFDNIPSICKEVINSGCDVKWYIIGYGGDEKLIKSKIKELGMEDRVIMLGKKINPYPYIKACDIYVQPSRYEGKAVTVREAQILNKPVVITNFATANSQLDDGFDGVIVPMDNEGCAKGIVKLIKDKELQSKLIENTKKTDYSNKEEIKKIYNILGE